MEPEAEVLGCVLAAIEAGSFPLVDEWDLLALLAALEKLPTPEQPPQA